MAWISVANSLVIAAQTALPDWVRARGMSIYQMALMGGAAAGSLVWGQVAGLASVRAAVLAAAVFGVVGGAGHAPAQRGRPRRDRLLARRRGQPAAGGHRHRARRRAGDGDASNTCIDPARAADFAEVMQRTRRARLRQGALSWGLFRDTAQPGRYVEYFVDENWLEHQRRLERFSAFDAELRARRLAFHLGPEPPLTRRYVADGPAARAARLKSRAGLSAPAAAILADRAFPTARTALTHTFDWTTGYASQRSPVFARNVVSTSHPLAAQAGLRMLQAGGNAVDAIIATAAVLTIVEPCSNGLGSDAFCILWDGAQLHGLNASGRAPAAWTPEYFRAKYGADASDAAQARLGLGHRARRGGGLGGLARALRQAALRRPAGTGHRDGRARLCGAGDHPAEVAQCRFAARTHHAARLCRGLPAALGRAAAGRRALHLRRTRRARCG